MKSTALHVLRRGLAIAALFTPVLAASQATQEVRASLDERAALRADFLAIAERYASFEWSASESNVLHGEDANGTRVDTPDASFDEDGWRADGSVNHGMPYAWGGFTSIEEFEKGLELGMYAGNVPRTERARPSARALGLDCSGFVARAWDLPTKHSTRSLGGLCYELESCDQLEPGDILNKFDSHVVLFKEWLDAEHREMRVIEAARLRVQENVHTTASMLQRGFVPMRYKPLDARWVSMELGDLQFSSVGDAKPGKWKTDAGAAELEFAALENPLRDALPHEWARYSVVESQPGYAGRAERTMMVAGTEAGQVHTQAINEIDGKEEMTGRSCAAAAPFAEVLVDFLARKEPLGEMTPMVSSVELGSYELAGRSFPARRILLVLEGSTVMRHKAFPVTIEIDCVQSDEVPLHGILEASFKTEIVWESDETGEPTAVSQLTQSFALRAFGGES